MTTNLERKCIEREWKCVTFQQVWIDEVFDRLMESLNDKYCVIPTFMRGYDDPMTSKVYFQNDVDAWTFQVLIKDLMGRDPEDEEVFGYFQIGIDADGFSTFIIVGKAYWDENGHLDGDGLDEYTEGVLPDRFYALAECCYEHDYVNDDEARRVLIESGFDERNDLI